VEVALVRQPKDFPGLLKEDALLRKYLKARLGHAAIAEITSSGSRGRSW
jgi:hypothetical protein